MRYFLLVAVFPLLLSCNPSVENSTEILQSRIDSLQKKLDHVYAPGLGEFMSSIQVHHNKLWFAGTSGNWELANFEMEEIRESIEDINRYNTYRPEIISLPMIVPPLDSLESAIRQKNMAAFKSSFTLLTYTCNNCHKATKHAFNVIRIPDKPPFSNQSFEK